MRHLLTRRRALIVGAASVLAPDHPARAQLGLLGVGQVASGVTANTFDPASLQSSWALSGGDLTATHSGTTNQTCRGTKILSTGSPSWRFTINAGRFEWGIGFCDASKNLATSMGGDTHSIACTWDGGVFINGSALGSTWGPGFLQGDTLDFKYISATPSISVSRNGASFGTPVSISTFFAANTALYPAIGNDANSNGGVGDFTNWN